MRTYRFAMVVPSSKQAKLFSACDIALSARNRLVELLLEERVANRALKDDGREADAHWTSNAGMDKLVSAWAKTDEKLSRLHSHILQDVVDHRNGFMLVRPVD
jgi:hypothetical protein